MQRAAGLEVLGVIIYKRFFVIGCARYHIVRKVAYIVAYACCLGRLVKTAAECQQANVGCGFVAKAMHQVATGVSAEA